MVPTADRGFLLLVLGSAMMPRVAALATIAAWVALWAFCMVVAWLAVMTL